MIRISVRKSWPTGYTWLNRYSVGGSTGVAERSRRPRHSPKQTSAETEKVVVALRQRWPDWGAPKLHTVLLREHPEWSPITVRTVHRILDRQGLIQAENRSTARRSTAEHNAPMKFAHGCFIHGCCVCRQFAHPQHGVVKVDRVEMIAQGLATGGDAVFDDFRRLTQGEGVALDGVGSVRQVNVVRFLQGEQRRL
jgi:hypothetical protein